jgi:hypothetical protein
MKAVLVRLKTCLYAEKQRCFIINNQDVFHELSYSREGRNIFPKKRFFFTNQNRKHGIL